MITEEEQLFADIDREAKQKQDTLDRVYMRVRIAAAIFAMDPHAPGIFISILDDAAAALAPYVSNEIKKAARDTCDKIYRGGLKE